MTPADAAVVMISAFSSFSSLWECTSVFILARKDLMPHFQQEGHDEPLYELAPDPDSEPGLFSQCQCDLNNFTSTVQTDHMPIGHVKF